MLFVRRGVEHRYRAQEGIASCVLHSLEQQPLPGSSSGVRRCTGRPFSGVLPAAPSCSQLLPVALWWFVLARPGMGGAGVAPWSVSLCIFVLSSWLLFVSVFLTASIIGLHFFCLELRT